MGRPLSQRHWNMDLYDQGGYNVVTPLAWLPGMGGTTTCYITRQLSSTRFQLRGAWGYTDIYGEATLVNHYPNEVGQCAIGIYQYYIDGDEGIYGYVRELNDSTAVTFGSLATAEGGYTFVNEVQTPWQISNYSSNYQDPNFGSYIWTNAYNLD